MYINTGCLNITYICNVSIICDVYYIYPSKSRYSVSFEVYRGYLFDILLNRTAECKHITLVQYYISIFSPFFFFFAALVISLLYQGRFLAACSRYGSEKYYVQLMCILLRIYYYIGARADNEIS